MAANQSGNGSCAGVATGLIGQIHGKYVSKRKGAIWSVIGHVFCHVWDNAIR